MREYELMVVYDLAVQEAGGPDASVQQISTIIESRGGKLLKLDHWGRRRMAYPINRTIDGDYIVTRFEMEPGGVAPLEATLRIDERIYRHLVVRADELPAPLPPREPRQQPTLHAPAVAEAPASPEAAAPAAPVAEAAPEAPVAEVAAPEEPVAEIAAPEEPAAAVESPAEAASDPLAPADSE